MQIQKMHELLFKLKRKEIDFDEIYNNKSLLY